MAYNFISQFAQKLIEQAGLTVLPADYLDEYQLRLEDQILMRLGRVATEKLDEAGMKKYQELLKQADNKPEDVDQAKLGMIFTEHIPNYNELMAKTLDDFGAEFLEQIKKDPDQLKKEVEEKNKPAEPAS